MTLALHKLTHFIKPPRVASSAKFAGAKGSESQRMTLASDLNNKFFTLVDDIFEEKSKHKQKLVIQKDELAGCIKKILPDVSVKLEYGKDPRIWGLVDSLYDSEKKTVTGFLLKLRGNVKKDYSMVVLKHEMQHIFDYATQPKLVARDNTFALCGRLKNYTEEAEKNHMAFYEGVLYKVHNSSNVHGEMFEAEQEIRGHFRDLKTPRGEKIEILQKWRTGMKMEKAAYNEEAFFENPKSPEAQLKKVERQFLFDHKIKLLNKLLKEEIAFVRRQNSESYGGNAPIKKLNSDKTRDGFAF